MKQQYTNRVMKDLRGYFTTEERVKIIESCDNDRDRLLIRLLWKSGRRITEILMLKVKDIDFQNDKILWSILKKKNKDHKILQYMDFKTLQMLYHYIVRYHLKSENYLLHGANPNKHISRQRAFAIIRTLCKRAGITNVGDGKPHPHHFRHSFAIDLAKKADSPKDIILIMERLQHSSLGMTQQYLQFAEDTDFKRLLDDD